MKRFVILVFVVLTVFLVACTSTPELTSTNEVTKEIITEDALSQARTQLTAQDCEIGENAFARGDCYYQKAVIFEDASFCEKIEDFETFGVKDMCIDALKNCEKLTTTEEKDSCYSAKINVRHNAAITLNLGVDYLMTYCDKITITNKFIRGICYMDTAVLWSKPNICEKVSPEPIGEGFATISRDICYLQIAKAGYEDLSICEKVPPGQYGQEWCWFNVMNTKIACIKGGASEINGAYHTCRWDTYEAVEGINEFEKQAVLSQDETKCASITQPLSRDGCYAIVAVKKADKSICENIQTPLLKENYCYHFVDAITETT